MPDIKFNVADIEYMRQIIRELRNMLSHYTEATNISTYQYRNTLNALYEMLGNTGLAKLEVEDSDNG